MTWIILILKLFGFLEKAVEFEQAMEQKKKAQNIADIPTTKQERTDAANSGDL